MASTVFCTSCGQQIDAAAAACQFCGAVKAHAQAAQPTTQAANPFASSAPINNGYAPINAAQNKGVDVSGKSRVTAGVLALLLGGIGVHKFYLGKVWPGIIYLVLVWTYVPAIVALVEGIIYLTQDDNKFRETQLRTWI